MSLSLWLFYVFYLVQLLAFASFGVAEEGGTAALAINPRVFVGFEEAGGFIALTAVMLYQSRKTIKAGMLGLVGRGAEDPDPFRPLTGRWAVAGFVLANAFMVWWAVKAGMSWWGFAALLAVFYAVLVGASRLVAAGGVMYVDTGFFPRGCAAHCRGCAGRRPLSDHVHLPLPHFHVRPDEPGHAADHG